MLEGLAPTVKVFPCRVRTLGESLDESDRNIYMAAVSNVDVWSNNGLAYSLGKRGLKISEKSIRKHRRGECSCA